MDMTTATISGRLYHSDYGYVDVATTTTLGVGAGDPTSGVAVFTGSSSSITMTFAATGYTIETDIDGDSAIDDTKCFLSSGTETSCPL